MKRKFGTISVFLIIIIAVLTLVYGQPGEPEMKEEQRLITIGFSQVGAESDWRTANSISVKNTFMHTICDAGASITLFTT